MSIADVVRVVGKIAAQPLWVLSIDPSLSGFAIAHGPVSAAPVEHTTKTKNLGTAPAQRIERYRGAIKAAVQAGAIGCHVFVEGYSFGSATSAQAGHHDRSELRCLLYVELLARGCSIVEVAPATLKKFATGTGNANKAAVTSALAARYGRTFASDDQADAFGLWHLGHAALGQGHALSVATQPQREAAAVVRLMLPGVAS